MYSFVTFTPWDVAMLVVITLHATLLAYLHNPKHKAAVMTAPVPFTMATLALGLDVNVTHLAGLLNLLLYNYVVRWLHDKARLPILVSIALAILLYIAIGMAGVRLLPTGETFFWMVAATNIIAGCALHYFRSHEPQKGHRTPLPLHIKLPAIGGVVTMLIIIKRLLGGFAATFPMVGSVASYEMRYSLMAPCQAVAMMLMMVTPFQVTIRLCQEPLGLGGALAAGWVTWAITAMILLPRFLKIRPTEVLALDAVPEGEEDQDMAATDEDKPLATTTP